MWRPNLPLHYPSPLIFILQPSSIESKVGAGVNSSQPQLNTIYYYGIYLHSLTLSESLFVQRLVLVASLSHSHPYTE